MATKRGNPNMRKGQPSVNALGRAAPIVKAKQAIGSDGVISYGGIIETGERNPDLGPRRKWVTYANAYKRPPVAIAALLRSALFAGVKWSLTPNEAGGKDADKGMDVVQRGLLDARMPKPWNVVVRKAGMAFFNGFSLQATAMARRPDGLITYTEISNRPPHTIEKWFRQSTTEPFDHVQQRLDNGEVYQIPLEECFYCVNDTLSESPAGTGVLRLVVERLLRTSDYEALEGSELFSGMGGTPIARVPVEEINAGAVGSEEQIAAYKARKVAKIESIVADRIKTPNKRQYAVLDSKTYQGSDPNTISPIKKWDIEIVKAELQGLADIRKIITEGDLDVARMLGVEFVFVGGGKSSGTYGMHESKVSLFTTQLSADLDLMAVMGTMQLCRRLVAANGLDPDTATPDLVASQISTEDVLKTAQTLVQLNLAGLAPNHPAKISIFEQMNLPWQEEAEPVLPRMAPIGAQRFAAGPNPVENVDPNAEAPPKPGAIADRQEPNAEQPK